MQRHSLSFYLLLLFSLTLGCKSETSSSTTKTITLVPTKTIVSTESLNLSNPTIVRYNADVDEIYIYDSRQRIVFRVHASGERLGTIARTGNGPGEFERVSGIFIGIDCVYLVDDIQFLVHKYTLEGDFTSTFNYGVHSTSPINKVSVSRDGIVYIPNETSQDYLVRAFTWDNHQIGKFGEVPLESTHHIDYNELRNAVNDRRVPSFFLRSAFIIPDKHDLTIVYNSKGRVHRYVEDTLQWKSPRLSPTLFDSLTMPYFEFMEQLLRQADVLQILRIYEQGMVSQESVFVSTNTSFGQPMQLHAFDRSGNLNYVYVFDSDYALNGSFDINVSEGLVYVGNSNAEIIAYSLDISL